MGDRLTKYQLVGAIVHPENPLSPESRDHRLCGSVAGFVQMPPDWSPRGDWVVRSAGVMGQGIVAELGVLVGRWNRV